MQFTLLPIQDRESLLGNYPGNCLKLDTEQNLG
jgi:hypothetical protein